MKTPKPFSWRPAADSNTNPASSVLVDGTQPKLRLYLTFITDIWCCVHLSSFGNYFYLIRLFNRKKKNVYLINMFISLQFFQQSDAFS